MSDYSYEISTRVELRTAPGTAFERAHLESHRFPTIKVTIYSADLYERVYKVHANPRREWRGRTAWTADRTSALRAGAKWCAEQELAEAAR
jgi:hypothetical protein